MAFLNGPLVPGNVYGLRYREHVDKIMEAKDSKLLTAGEFAGLLALAGEMLSRGRFWEQASVRRVAQLLRSTEKWASKLLCKASSLGLIGWISGRGNGSRSFLGLAPELMPLLNERVSEDSNSFTVEDTEHNVSQPKERERESAPQLPANDVTAEPSAEEIDGPALSGTSVAETPRMTSGQDPVAPGPVGRQEEWSGWTDAPWELADVTEEPVGPETPAPVVPAECSPEGTGELLTPEEDHEEDARFAAATLAMHLFQRVPDRWTCQSMYRRFVSLPTGATTHVLKQALLGRPARTIDSPNAYAAEWIRRAEASVMQRQAA